LEWLGPQGTEAGLERSNIAASELRKLLEAQGRSIPAKISRKEIIKELLYADTKRLDKTLDEMLAMNKDDLLAYFKSKRPSQRELLAVLEELDFHPDSEAKKSLYKYAARQIGETGVFQRVAKSAR
jgi:hypothetical protein